MKQIIAATVAVILICLVAVPLIDDSTKEVHSVTQNTTQRYYATSAEGLQEDLTIALESQNHYTINGTPYEIPLSYIVIIAEPYIFAMYADNFNMYTAGSAWFGLGIGGSVTFDQEGSFVATSSNGTTKNGTFSSIIYPSLTGSLGYFQNKTAYADADSEIIFFNINNIFLAQKWKADGTFVENIVGPISATGESATISDVAMTSNPVEGGVADYSIKNLSFKTSTNTYTTNYFIAPIDYKTISDTDSVIITILNLVPVMLIVALVLGIGYSIARRD